MQIIVARSNFEDFNADFWENTQSLDSKELQNLDRLKSLFSTYGLKRLYMSNEFDRYPRYFWVIEVGTSEESLKEFIGHYVIVENWLFITYNFTYDSLMLVKDYSSDFGLW